MSARAEDEIELPAALGAMRRFALLRDLDARGTLEVAFGGGEAEVVAPKR